jgi:hypothetical protein
MSQQPDRITDLEDLGLDLARRHRATASAGTTVDPAVVEADLTALDREGYVILENLLSAEECERIRAAVTPLLDRTGRNTFEGERTQRVYSVLGKTRACDRLVDHPRVLALLDRLFLPNYLLSQLQVININPGEAAQLLHPSARRRSGPSTPSPTTTAPPSSCPAATAGTPSADRATTTPGSPS